MAYADISLEAPEAGLKADAPASEFYRIGLLYATGLGVAEDYVAAHKWFNLAAMKGDREARIARRELVDFMSTRELREAQRAAREWLQKAN